MAELMELVLSWPTLLLVLLVFGIAPGLVLRLIVLMFHRDDPRRRELIAELYVVPRIERPLWVAEQVEVALSEGLWERIVWAATGRVIDRWRLGSGVDSNRKYPDTFSIPDAEDKALLQPGDVVKLMFTTKDWGERMWVEVETIKRRRLVGRLRNTPIGIPRLDFDDKVKFKLDHIIDIDFGSTGCDCDPDPTEVCEHCAAVGRSPEIEAPEPDTGTHPTEGAA